MKSKELTYSVEQYPGIGADRSYRRPDTAQYNQDQYVPKNLAKRIEDWDDLQRATVYDAKTKSVDGMHYHKPGSENPRK